MDFRSFMLERVDGELNFLPAEGVSEGQNSPYVKFVNNDALVIGATPLSFVYPSNIVKNVADSDDPSYGEDEQTLVGPSLPPHPQANKKLKIIGKKKVASSVPGKALPSKVQKVAAQASKAVGEASTHLDVDSDFDIHEFPSAKELRDAIDSHWVVAHAVLDNDLDKNPLVSDMRTEIKVLQGQVDGLYSEYNMLILKEKKWVNYEQTLSSLQAKIEGIESKKERLKPFEIQLLQEIDSLKQDRAAVVSKLISDAAMKLVRSDDLEVAAMKEPFVLEKMLSYRPSSKEEYDQAGDVLANASYHFLAEYVVNPYASLEQLLSKKPPSLRPILSGPRSEPLSSKVK
ncbi:hypothetical protein Tco_0749584 [Tanacetum coccineum]|uniref:Uncharacterized protein n=1 Tax=Tanacetum coccineum TaxID=301880 RepID=A0ABQ4Z1V9_9ASTR